MLFGFRGLYHGYVLLVNVPNSTFGLVEPDLGFERPETGVERPEIGSERPLNVPALAKGRGDEYGVGMNKVLKSKGDFLVSLVRRQKCATTGCAEKSRLAMVVPCADIEPQEDGTLGPGLAAIVLCAECLEDSAVWYLKGR